MAKIRALGIPPSQLADVLRPMALSVRIHEEGRRPSTTAEKAAAGLVIGLMLMGIFTGMGYQFVSITGEKQIRVTEMIISAVSPQQWMDGKILGRSRLHP